VAPVGGLSGKVLCEKSFALLKGLASELFGKTVLISVGGIDSADEVYRRLKTGASLVQLYSSLVFHGPGLPHRINVDLQRLLAQDGANHIGEIIGCDNA
jgi:dihydroorotate dehydrogenase